MKLPVTMELVNYGIMGLSTINFKRNKGIRRAFKITEHFIKGDLKILMQRAAKLKRACMVAVF